MLNDLLAWEFLVFINKMLTGYNYVISVPDFPIVVVVVVAAAKVVDVVVFISSTVVVASVVGGMNGTTKTFIIATFEVGLTCEELS